MCGQAVEERRVWLERHLHQAAERLGADLSGDEVVNTYDMRSAGSRATEPDGTEVWLRVVLSVPDYQPACRWDGNRDANTITGVPKPQVLGWQTGMTPPPTGAATCCCAAKS